MMTDPAGSISTKAHTATAHTATGQILQLFRKPAPGVWVEPQATLMLQRGYGIDGDVNAKAGSPRQVLLAGQPSLERFGLTAGDLQENILLDLEIETLASGMVVQLGDSAQIRLMELCIPCATLDRLQPGLSRRIRGKRGLLGMVIQDGEVRVGDRLSILPHRFPALPDSNRGKFEAFVARIPPGTVVRIPDLLLAMGLLSSYARAVPALIKKAPPHLPVHRLLTTDGSLLSRHIPHQAERLTAEGIPIQEGRVAPDYAWHPQHFYALDPPRALTDARESSVPQFKG